MTEDLQKPYALVVDDDPLFRAATVAALARQGLEVREAVDGESALEAVAERAPDVVLLDAQMPRMDGFETCAHLRALPGRAGVPVMMLTALDDEESIRRAYEAGATDFHSKPPRWSILGQRVRFMVRAARLRDEFERSQLQAARAQRLARLGHWEWDLGQGRVELSAECARLLGFSPDARFLEPMKFLAAFHEKDRPLLTELAEASEAMALAGDLGPYTFECRIPARPAPRIVRIEAAVVRAADGKAARVNAVLQDVTERRLAEERIHSLANFDTLTGFATRPRFHELIQEALVGGARPGHVAVVLVELRRLALVNESLGASAADRLLRESGVRVAAGLARSLERHADVRGVVGRPSRSTFGVLLAGAVDAAVAAGVAEAILQELALPVAVGGHEVMALAAAGIALAPQDGGDADELLTAADHAVLEASGRRPNSWARAPRAKPRAGAEALELETALHHALERGELLLHFQPQIDVRTGRAVSAEALIRWRHDGELRPPSVFIPVAEETGLIEPIEEWAILSACWQHRLWREAGLAPLPIAVNLTANHFLAPSLIPVVEQALAETGVPPAHLELEITESVLLADLRRAVAQMEAINNLGVRISIDDFGTGYSSLAYLRSLPIDRLKVDKSFVNDLGKSRDADVMVGTVLGMARALGLKVVAEGVESRLQAERLAAHGCAVMQGYLFSRPLASDPMRALVAAPRHPDWKIGAPARAATSAPEAVHVA